MAKEHRGGNIQGQVDHEKLVDTDDGDRQEVSVERTSWQSCGVVRRPWWNDVEVRA